MSINIKSLAESNVLIVGGTAGVGLATAIHFAKAGVAGIAIVGRNAERGEAAKQTVLKTCPQANILFISADANKPDQALSASKTMFDHFGSIDALVCCTVGTAGPCLLHNIPIEELESIVTEQMMGPLYITRAVLPYMREQKSGAIINIASDAAKLATPGESVIGAAMAGIVMFTKTVALEGKRDGIRANILTPSVIENTLTYDRMKENEFSKKLFAGAEKLAQLGLVQPDDLAAMAVYLASPESAKMTGQAISINGGISVV